MQNNNTLLCEDYYLSAHGSTVDNFELPYNVRVIMLCEFGSMTACTQNEFNFFSTITRPYGLHLENLTFIYNTTDINLSGINPSKYKLCVYTPNFNFNYLVNNDIIKEGDREKFNDIFKGYSKLCPNLYIKKERIEFRSGLFNVPLDYNRIYINDHLSPYTGKFTKAGTIEKIDTSIATEYQNLLTALQKSEETLIDKNSKEIKNLLLDEIIKRYQYKEGLYQYYTKNNSEIKKAVTLFNNIAEYNKILKI